MTIAASFQQVAHQLVGRGETLATKARWLLLLLTCGSKFVVEFVAIDDLLDSLTIEERKQDFVETRITLSLKTTKKEEIGKTLKGHLANNLTYTFRPHSATPVH